MNRCMHRLEIRTEPNALVVQRDHEQRAAAHRQEHAWSMALYRIGRMLRWTRNSPSYLVSWLGFKARLDICD